MLDLDFRLKISSNGIYTSISLSNICHPKIGKCQGASHILKQLNKKRSRSACLPRAKNTKIKFKLGLSKIKIKCKDSSHYTTGKILELTNQNKGQEMHNKNSQ